MAWLPAGQSLAARAQLIPLMNAFTFTSCVPFANNTPLTEQGSAREGVLFRAASHSAPPDKLLIQIEQALGLTSPDILHYADKKRGQRRTAKLTRVGENAELTEFLLAGDTSAEAWIKAVLESELPAQTYGRLLLSPGAKAPIALQACGKVICSCFGVTDAAIDSHLTTIPNSTAIEESPVHLQNTLKCGINYGSCLPEFKRMLQQAHEAQFQRNAATRAVIPIGQTA